MTKDERNIQVVKDPGPNSIIAQQVQTINYYGVRERSHEGSIVISEELVKDYMQCIKTSLEVIDLGGLSPSIGGQVVKIHMKDVFIPVRSKADQPILPDLSDSRTNDVDSSPGGGTAAPPAVATTEREASDIQSMLENPRVVLLGHPGSGKTTVGKYVAYCLCTGTNDLGPYLAGFIPLMVKATDFANALSRNHNLNLKHFLIKSVFTKPGYQQLLAWAINSGKCLVIIDGLDEISKLPLRVKVSERIESFINEYRDNRFIISSRIIGYMDGPLSGDFSLFTLEEFNDSQIQEFLRSWFKAIGSKSESEIATKSRALWNSIRKTTGIRRLAGNPLLLTIIALTAWRGTKLPDRRVELYKLTTETLIENWPLDQRQLQIQSQQVLQVLEPIAFYMLDRGYDNKIAEGDLLPLFEEQMTQVLGTPKRRTKTDSKKLLRTIQVDIGLFLIKGIHEAKGGVYGFFHSTFAEYFAARHLATLWCGDGLKLSQYVHVPRWNEALLLMAGHVAWSGMTPLATKLLKEILNLSSPYEEYLQRDLRLVVRMLLDNVQVSVDLVIGTIKTLTDVMMTTPHFHLWQVCSELIRAIAEVYPKFVPKIEIRSSDDYRSKVRKAVILSKLGRETDQVATILLEGFKSHSEEVKLFASSGITTHLMVAVSENHVGIYGVSAEFSRVMRRVLQNLNTLDDLMTFSLDPVQTGLSTMWFLDADNANLDIEQTMGMLTGHRSLPRTLLAMSLGLAPHTAQLWTDLIKRISEPSNPKAQLLGFQAVQSVLTNSFAPLSRELRVSLCNHLIAAIESRYPSIRHKAFELLTAVSADNSLWEPMAIQGLQSKGEKQRHRIYKAIFRSHRRPSEAVLDICSELFGSESEDNRELIAKIILKAGRVRESQALELVQAVQLPKRPDARSVRESIENIVYVLNLFPSGSIYDALSHQLCIALTLIEETTASVRLMLPARRVESEDLSILIEQLLVAPKRAYIPWVLQVWSYFRPRKKTIPPSILALLNHENEEVQTTTCSILLSRDLQQTNVQDKVLDIIESGNSATAREAYRAIKRLRSPTQRRRVSDRLVSILDSSPSNLYAYKSLWDLNGEPDSDSLAHVVLRIGEM